VRLSGLEPETYGLKVRSDEIASSKTAITSDFIAERLGVLLGALGPDFEGLAIVVKAWPALAEPMRRAVLAMVEASR
jgi:hypothetical protein